MNEAKTTKNTNVIPADGLRQIKSDFIPDDSGHMALISRLPLKAAYLNEKN